MSVSCSGVGYAGIGSTEKPSIVDEVMNKHTYKKNSYFKPGQVELA